MAERNVRRCILATRMRLFGPASPCASASAGFGGDAALQDPNLSR